MIGTYLLSPTSHNDWRRPNDVLFGVNQISWCSQSQLVSLKWSQCVSFFRSQRRGPWPLPLPWRCSPLHHASCARVRGHHTRHNGLTDRITLLTSLLVPNFCSTLWPSPLLLPPPPLPFVMHAHSTLCGMRASFWATRHCITDRWGPKVHGRKKILPGGVIILCRPGYVASRRWDDALSPSVCCLFPPTAYADPP